MNEVNEGTSKAASFKRECAFKCSVNDIQKSSFIKQEGFQSSFLLTNTKQKITRVNLMGVVVAIQNEPRFSTILLDDGSGRITIKNFDQEKQFTQFSLADIINIIGRVRAFENETYITPEIIKKVNNQKWIKVRKLELNKQRICLQETPQDQSKQENTNSPPTREVIKEQVIPFSENKTFSSESKPSPTIESERAVEKIFALIREQDKGEGANFEEIIQLAQDDNAEQSIAKLLKEGEIFEVSPGKLKVLE